MKLPSLNTAEGMVVLASALAAAYVIYKLSKGASNIADQVQLDLHNGLAAVGIGDKIAAPGTQSTTSQHGLNGFDVSSLFPSHGSDLRNVSLAQDSDYLTIAVPPSESPRTDGLNDSEVGSVGGADDIGVYENSDYSAGIL